KLSIPSSMPCKNHQTICPAPPLQFKSVQSCCLDVGDVLLYSHKKLRLDVLGKEEGKVERQSKIDVKITSRFVRRRMRHGVVFVQV
ncbi:hypothetical protein PENTCL1PPCAC_2727, partial [Pristionchus entomophagus]